FPGKSLPPERSTAALMDRYHSHTKHCGSCGPALQRIKQIRTGALIVSASIWSLMPLVIALSESISWPVGALLGGIPLLSAALWLWLGKLEQKFYKGDATPPRNLPG
ncbi:MAG: cell death suppressor protein Lls1, partial [Cyanobacteria bacterium P01_D01_bin.2]